MNIKKENGSQKENSESDILCFNCPIVLPNSGVHRGRGGSRAPATLRSDAKVPLRSGLCDMNDIVDDKMSPRSAFEEISLYLATAHILSAAVLALLYQYTVQRHILYIQISKKIF